MAHKQADWTREDGMWTLTCACGNWQISDARKKTAAGKHEDHAIEEGETWPFEWEEEEEEEASAEQIEAAKMALIAFEAALDGE